jgi:hypothetical protein
MKTFLVTYIHNYAPRTGVTPAQRVTARIVAANASSALDRTLAACKVWKIVSIEEQLDDDSDRV